MRYGRQPAPSPAWRREQRSWIDALVAFLDADKRSRKTLAARAVKHEQAIVDEEQRFDERVGAAEDAGDDDAAKALETAAFDFADRNPLSRITPEDALWIDPESVEAARDEAKDDLEDTE